MGTDHKGKFYRRRKNYQTKEQKEKRPELRMHTFEELSQQFAKHFAQEHFPTDPPTLYNPNRYFLGLGGKRIRPVLCLMGNELFGGIHKDAWHVANAIELFHNFTLIHDDIMDAAPLRRGMPTMHEKYGQSTALLAGDVMFIVAYDYINKISTKYLSTIISIANKMAKEVCEGQQLDMDFENRKSVSFDEYIHMINLKTSVLLGASLKMGAVINDAAVEDQNHIYEFGRKLGLAFQVQDDYLDAFGNPDKFGKQIGGDIKANKKTFLLIHALEAIPRDQKNKLNQLLFSTEDNKVSEVLTLFKESKVDEWAMELKEKYLQQALTHLDAISVDNDRKEPLQKLAHYLIKREH
jgi:geranylgeranyl diphosphate synthase type II